jgi:hypothetical protein
MKEINRAAKLQKECVHDAGRYTPLNIVNILFYKEKDIQEALEVVG